MQGGGNTARLHKPNGSSILNPLHRDERHREEYKSSTSVPLTGLGTSAPQVLAILLSFLAASGQYFRSDLLSRQSMLPGSRTEED